MIEKDKILKIENAKQSMANFLMAMDIKFTYDTGTFYILDNHNPSLFIDFCKTYGISQTELDSMTITEVENNI